MDISEPDGTAEQEDCQQWACGPMGFWPVLGFVPAGVTWSVIPERQAQAAGR